MIIGLSRLPNWRRGMLLLALLLAALTTSGTLHAREYAGNVELECSGHTDTDTATASSDDRSGSDDGQPIQHHATCHVAAAFLPEAERTSLHVIIAGSVNRPSNTAFLGLPRIAPDLRPPIA